MSKDGNAAKKLRKIPVKVETSDDSSLYAKHQKVYPREVKGRFQNLRNWAVFALLGLYYILPWVSWDGVL